MHVNVYSVNSVYAYLRGCASSFFIEEALLLAAFGKWLAWESSYVDVDSAIWFNVGVLPSVGTNL